ncbi:MAG: shikimate dehydrogenase [Thiotrichales bacterium]|jgi:shikimate dehydrogenase|nr:shikimate dehydrogenase [Thiotrichales bacterium]MBT3837946.1 shikimate dehydrogenase [Thiotrichales bacterium]MBT7005439.1 shikimate dehydrogenase [Thiotrichales bacterium]
MDHYLVVGNPIEHSRSPQIHAMFAEQTDEQLEYDKQQIEEGHFREVMQEFKQRGVRGINVTVPYKHEAWEFVDERSPDAELAGAVNTIEFNQDGSSYGGNTDGSGLLRDLTVNQNFSLANQRILILGAGGAVRGILAPLLSAKPKNIVIANRTAERAEKLADIFIELGAVEGGGYEALNGQQFDLIINATSASLQGKLPPLPLDILAADGICYDLMYATEPTPFMQWGEEHGAAKVSDGLGMLVEQAADAFKLWRGIRPETEKVIATLR